MKLKFYIFLSMTLFISSCSFKKEKPENDFQKVCDVAENFDWKKIENKEEQRSMFSKKVSEALPNTLAAQSIDALVYFVESKPYERYEMFVMGAKESGAVDLKCAKLKQHF